MKTELENQIIKECLKSILKTIRRNPTNNEFYVDADELDYKLLSDNAVKTLKKLAENY